MTDSTALLHVHSSESFGTHDGPGIRLVVFMQGCNIRCKYCHNPDSIEITNGTPTTINEIVRRAVRMKPYFEKEGGVTISGGEPLLQAKLLIKLFSDLRKENIHTNIDTNGTIRTEEAQLLLSEYADLVMFDLKGTTSQEFINITGVNKLPELLANIELREQSKKPYWLRYVLIPGVTDSAKNFEYIINTFSKNKFLTKLEVLPYHKLGVHKWKELGWKYEFEDILEYTAEQVNAIKKNLSHYFVIE